MAAVLVVLEKFLSFLLFFTKSIPGQIKITTIKNRPTSDFLLFYHNDNIFGFVLCSCGTVRSRRIGSIEGEDEGSSQAMPLNALR